MSREVSNLARRRRVDECHVLDIGELRRAGLFTKGPGHIWHRRLFRGNGPGAFDPLDVCCVLHLSATEYGPAFLGVAWKSTHQAKQQTIQLRWARFHYGLRFWLGCLHVQDGGIPLRRCQKLYLPPGADSFRCRECHRLTYKRATAESRDAQ